MNVRFVVALVFAVALAHAAPAAAADMVVKTPPPAPAPASVPSWTGFYVGASIGGGIWDAKTTAIAGLPFQSALDNAGKGWLAKLTLGYDRQFGDVVAGVFADYQPERLKGTFSSSTAFFFFNQLGGEETESASWALGGRAGYLLTPAVLTYLNAGLSEAHFDGIFTVDLGSGFPFGPMPGHVYPGWFVGGGVETELTFLPIHGLFFNTEYRYANYGWATLPTFFTPIGVRPAVQTITSGLVYKFGAPDPAPHAMASSRSIPSLPSWTGFYLGAGAGFGLWDAETTSLIDPGGPPNASPVNNAGRGWLARFTGGYDRRFGDYLAGGFAEIDPAHIAGTVNTALAVGPVTMVGGEATEQWNWAAGARAGYLVTPQILSYVNGGFTQARFGAIDITGLGAGTAIGQVAAQSYDGWFLGGGFEIALDFLPVHGLYFNTEYRYASYGAERIPAMPAAALFFVGDLKISPTVQTVTSGVTYKFD